MKEQISSAKLRKDIRDDIDKLSKLRGKLIKAINDEIGPPCYLSKIIETLSLTNESILKKLDMIRNLDKIIKLDGQYNGSSLPPQLRLIGN